MNMNFYEHLSKTDPEVAEIISEEYHRQDDQIELIASENFTSFSVMEAMGSVLTNKYAEGYPGHRYYGGCEVIDKAENLARERTKKLFGCEHANVQPHAGSQTNMAVYFAVLKPGDTILSMNLTDGGHLSHGSPVSFSGKLYNVVSYGVNKESELIDFDQLRDLAKKHKPKLIVCGASAYPRIIDAKKFREIADEVGAYLMVDMAHIAGLVATGLHPSPLPYADVVTTTTHKTLRGPRGGMILTNSEEIINKINKTIFPGIQGGPLMHVIGAKAQCFSEALQPEFKKYQEQVVKNAKVLSDTLIKNGFKIITGGTDNHLLLVDVTPIGITGVEAEKLLDSINITVNKNTIPYDKEKPTVTSGIRLGTPAMTTRGFTEKDFIENKDDKEVINKLKKQVLSLTNKYPII